MLRVWIGWIIILDGCLSIALVHDKRFLWQLGRAVRILLGLILILMKGDI
jgi:hypothetical protein